MANTKNLKLTGVKSFNHPAFKHRGSGDVVHVKKGEVVKVDLDLADYLSQRSQRVGPEDERPTWTETSDKHTHDFSTVSAAPAADSAETEETGEDGNSAAKPAAGAQRARTTRATK